MELAAKGAYSGSQVYSPSDVADIVSYAGAVRPLLISSSIPLTPLPARY
jgi:hypothetical protein